MNRHSSSIACLALCLSLAGCANYDFAMAKKASGEWDMQKLIADLQTSGETQLSNGIWIPLIYTNLTTFSRSHPLMPDGYTLRDMTAIAPIFCAGSHEEWIVDEAGAPVEQSDRWWVGWGLLLHDYDEYVHTPSGLRCHGRFRWLALFGNDSVHYLSMSRKSNAPGQSAETRSLPVRDRG